jgi:4-hydroxyphenylacetate 3-monooxygenase
MPISDWTLTTDGEVSVQRERTSGEVEIVTVVRGGELYVGVGSDHTDRTLEATDIPWSKQVCANVLAPVVWPWGDVREHWDRVLLESDVLVEGKRAPYQRAGVAEFWTPEEMVRSLEGRIEPPTGDYLVFSGTVVTLGRALIFADTWTIRLIDPVRGERIEHTYRVPILSREVR